MVPSDWDLALKCLCGPNFISDSNGESPILSASRVNLNYGEVHVTV